MHRGALAVGALALSALASALPATASHAPGTFTAQGSVLAATSPGYPLFGAPGMCDPGSPNQGVTGYSVRLPERAGGHRYTLRTAGLNDVDIAFTSEGACAVVAVHAAQGQTEVGVVPAAARWAYVVLSRGASADFTFAIPGARSAP